MKSWDKNELVKEGIGWRFPSNDHGKEDGLNDAGIETFLNSPIESLTRETIQNSLDAKNPDLDRPVEVHFKLKKVPTNVFPQGDTFKEILHKCKSYHSDKKTKDFFDKAIKTISADQIEVLVISDYNTTGLRGAEEGKNSDWNRLIKWVGSSDKGLGSGGSFGIGKHAPFACSALRTLFYGTKDIDNQTAFQGKSILVTHVREADETTQGTGYFGHSSFNTAILGFEKLPEFFCRDEYGTDLFIVGFNAYKDWETKLIKAVLEEFFVAIKSGRLIVHVENTIINESSIIGLMELYSEADVAWLAGKYFNSLISEKSIHRTEKDFLGMGEIELYVLPEKDYPKRIAMVRATGMKIFDKNRFHTPLRFAGVFIAKGKEINEFLRRCEPPTHDLWIAERYENDKEMAASILDKLNRWIRDIIREITDSDESEELDVEGMSQFLPDDFDEDKKENHEDKEGEKGAPIDIQLRDNYRKPNSDKSTPGAPDITTEDGEMGGSTGGRQPENPDGGNGGSDGGTGEGPGAGSGDGSGNGQQGKEDGGKGNSSSKLYRQISVKNTRLYCKDVENGIYFVAFEPEKSSKDSILTLKVLGDTNDEAAPIMSAKVLETNQDLEIISDGKLGKFELISGQRVSFEIKLSCTERCALGVSAYGNEIS